MTLVNELYLIEKRGMGYGVDYLARLRIRKKQNFLS